MMNPCVDLRAICRDRFRLRMKESYAGERSDFRQRERPALTSIRCRHGKLFPWGGRLLAAHCTAGARTRQAVASVPGTRVVQGAVLGCPEIAVTFDVDLLDRLADVMQAQRPRRLSPEARAAAAARMAAVRACIKRPSHGQGDGSGLGTASSVPCG